jgi:predicted ATPase
VVVTCRSDEVPLDAAAADWVTHLRRDAGVEEIRLGPLSQREVAEQIAALTGTAAPGELVEEVYARAEGHPFFTEQLVAAALTDAVQLAAPVALPARLAEPLVARAARCGGGARAVLSALPAAGRPLTERLVGEVVGLDEDTVRAAVRELAGGQLLATADGGHRPRLTAASAAEQIDVRLRRCGSSLAAGDRAVRGRTGCGPR